MRLRIITGLGRGETRLECPRRSVRKRGDRAPAPRGVWELRRDEATRRGTADLQPLQLCHLVKDAAEE